MGATVVGKLPNVGGGAFAAAHQARFYQERMAEVRAEEALLRQLGLSEAALQTLTELAEKGSTPEQPVTLMRVAADLLEEATAKHRRAG